MKNFKFALGVLLALAFSMAPVLAREISGTPSTAPDAWSVFGGSPACYSGGNVVGCEVAVDYTGNFVPTVTNAQTLGSASLAWSQVYSVTATNTGNETNGTSGAVSSTGLGGTAASQSIVNGLQVFTKVAVGTGSGATFGVWSSTTIPVSSSYEVIIGSGASSSLLTSTPNISTTTVVGPASTLTGIPSGTFLILSSTAPAGAIFQDEGTLTNSKLQLGASTREVKQYKTLVLVFDATDGYRREISYGNN